MERDWTTQLDSEIKLIRASYRTLETHAEALSDDFFRRLFDADPRLRYLFPEDISGVRDHLLRTIAAIVWRHDRAGEVRHQLANLGARHAAYGVEPSDYDKFLEAIVATLGSHLGLGPDHESLHAWRTFFTAVANTMIEGATECNAAV